MGHKFVPIGETIKVKAIKANDLRVGDRLLDTAWLATTTIEVLEYVLFPRVGPRHFRYRVVGQKLWEPAHTLRWDDVVAIVVDGED